MQKSQLGVEILFGVRCCDKSGQILLCGIWALVGLRADAARGVGAGNEEREWGQAARGAAPRPPTRAARAVAAGHELPVFFFFAPTWVKTTSF